MKRLILALAFGAALFQLFAAGIEPFTALVMRPVHLAFMGMLGFLGLGVRGRLTQDGDEPSESSVSHIIRWIFIGATLFACIYIVLQQEELVRRAGSSTTLGLVAGALAIVVVLELARRTTGWGLVAVAILALAYAFVGPWLPGLLAHRGYSLVRIVQHLYLSTEGIWGVPLGVSADFVYLFVLFGTVLEVAGGGTLLIALASRVAGTTRGGPAKTATVASAIMGSLSGSAVANVVTTGSLTIPMMKRTGFKASFAGAIEAAASTGGQIMPPIMGAGAFILATWTNIPYVRVAAAAAIPAVLYYVALLAAVHFEAERSKLPRSARPEKGAVVSRLHLLLPLAVIVVLLTIGRSPMRAAFWGVITAALSTIVTPATRLKAADFGTIFLGAARGTVQVAAACAAAGIVVGVASLTGIGLRMSEFIVTLSGGHLPIALVLTAVGSIILGMGLPTTAAYVVLAALGAPALTDLGVPLLAAHLFIFYFGCLSNVTPPVSLAAYAAAGIAGAPPMTTAFTAMAIAGAGFLVPFMFVYDPALLLDSTVVGVIVAGVTAGLGVLAFAGTVVGYLRRPLAVWERLILGAIGVGLMQPHLWVDVIGLASLATVMVLWKQRPIYS